MYLSRKVSLKDFKYSKNKHIYFKIKLISGLITRHSTILQDVVFIQSHFKLEIFIKF